jgi:glycine/D-amino acid oxidase-like deaminating enzyme
MSGTSWTTDTAVVGSGMAGAAVGAELAQAGVDHLVLEAGPDLGRAHIGAHLDTTHLADPARDPSFAPFAIRGNVYGPASGLRRRVGGRSLYWRGICLRIEPQALTRWPAHLAALLGRRYVEVEAQLSAWSCRPCLTLARTDTERRVTDRILDLGYQATPTPRAIRILENGRWAAYSPLFRTPAPTVLTGYEVRELRAAGPGFLLISADGSRLAARRVVLAAGLFANLALLAGLLGTTSEFRTFDHVASGVLAVLPPDDDAVEPMDISIHAGFHLQASSNLMVERRPDRAGLLWDVWAMGEQPPEAASRVRVRKEGVTVDLDRSGRAAVGEVHAAQHDIVGTLMERLRAPLAAGRALPFAQALSLARARTGVAVRYEVPLGELDHESGGLPLGGQHVDDDGGVRAVPGLFVVGPCVFHRAGAANPTLTNLALAGHVARNLC